MEKPAYEDTLRILPDWVDAFCEYAGEPGLPSIFTTWTAISTIAAVLERRVYTHLRREPLVPNLYVLLVSPPGGGKSTTIKRATELVRQIRRGIGEAQQRLRFAPDDLTKASLLDAFSNSRRLADYADIDSEYCGLYLAADEFGTAMSFLASDLLSVISKLYDPQASYEEQRRGRGAKPLVIPNPVFNIISGVQPGFLAQNVPELAWQQGFLARFIMIYAEPGHRKSIFSITTPSEQDRDMLLRDLNTMYSLKGALAFSGDAREAMEEASLTTGPAHPRLRNYVPRRPFFIAKLAVVSAVSRSNAMMIGAEDVIRATQWLTEAEATMPLIFKNMQGTSDEMILNEALYEMRERYRKNGFIDPSELAAFLASRAKGHLVGHLIRLSFQRGDYQTVNGLIVPN